jgi:hypothetical protein
MATSSTTASQLSITMMMMMMMMTGVWIFPALALAQDDET